MSRRRCLLLLALLAALSLPAARSRADEKPALDSPVAKLDLKDGDTVVFLGDSITHQCLYTQYVEDYFYTRFPKQRIRFHNSGVGGDVCADGLARFDRDVAHYKPKVVTILLGMNDFGSRGFDEERFQTYRTGMEQLIERVKALGATPVLITPTMYDARAARANPSRTITPTLPLFNGVLAFYGEWLREIAVEQGYGFVDMHSPLNGLTLESRKTDPSFTMIRDAVHPDAPGQVVMAFALLNDLGVPRQVSNISISRAADGKPQSRATGGKLSDVEFTSDGLQFTFAADSLPLALPAEAQLGVKLTKLGHRMSREALDIHGLTPGRYQLLIDSQPVGAYASDALDRHIELQENDKTPQYQQALAVAELNKQRNDQAMRPVRNQWREKKTYRRAQAQAKANPNDEKLKQQLAALEESQATFEARLAALESKLGEFEDRIYQANQPRPHKYQLVRLTDAK